jgi:type VI secretion system protein ImpF
MAELTNRERLQPSLLDRLTDEAPWEPSESRDRRIISAARLRECVTRDISWLLNCTSHWSEDALEGHDHVHGSVLNYGIPDLAGMALTGIDAGELEQRIRQAILHFEPRLTGGTLSVHVGVDAQRMDNRALTFDIQSQMWAQPMPLNLYLKTELDLDTGEFRVGEQVG